MANTFDPYNWVRGTGG